MTIWFMMQIGLVTYSTSAGIEFDLNDFQSYDEVFTALDNVVYTRGWTATALALTLTRFMLDPNRQYGARPFAAGIPKVAILLTDGRSNQIPITDRANALRNFGIQVSNTTISTQAALTQPSRYTPPILQFTLS